MIIPQQNIILDDSSRRGTFFASVISGSPKVSKFFLEVLMALNLHDFSIPYSRVSSTHGVTIFIVVYGM